jgi:hypothetical protein
MSFGLPNEGDLDWADPVNDSIEATRSDAATAKADSASARDTATAAYLMAQNAKEFVEAPTDEQIATKMEEVGSATRTALTASTEAAIAANFITPQMYDAKGDGRTVADAVLVSGQSKVQSATANYTSADVGKRIVVLPAPGSSQATFATTITARTSATEVATASPAPYSGTGLESTCASDDTVALQAWLSATTTMKRWLPAGIYGFSAGLTLGGWYAVECGAGSTLKVMAQIAAPTGWPGSARTVPTAISTSFTTLNTSLASWRGGVLDTSDLCTDGFTLKWVRTYVVDSLMVRGVRGSTGVQARMFSFGDAQTSGSTYQISVRNCLGWRDFGMVPTSATALAVGGTAESVGLFFDANCTDSQVDGRTTMMGSQVGFDTYGGNIVHIGSHAWSRATIGWMDYAFDDHAGHNHYISTYADTPKVTGYRLRGSYYTCVGITTYNNSAYGLDNTIAVIELDNPSSGHAFLGVKGDGADSSHRLATIFRKADGTIPSVPYPTSGIVGLNTVLVPKDTTPSRTSYTITADQGIFSSDAFKFIEVNSSSTVTITLDSGNRLVDGNVVDYQQIGAGQVAFVAGSGVTLHSAGGFKTRTKWSTVRLRRIAADEYLLTGDVVPDRWSSLATGEETHARLLNNSGALSNPTGQIRFNFFTAQKTEAITALAAYSGTTAASGLTLCRMGIWSVDSSGNLTLVASTASDTALFVATNTRYSKALSATFNKVAGTRYAFGILQVGTTAANFHGALIQSSQSLTAPIVGALVSGQADLPASVSVGSLSANGALPYAEMAP